jgi:hypothetical protein
MDGKILEMFMKENDAWDDLIARQSKELPQLEHAYFYFQPQPQLG